MSWHCGRLCGFDLETTGVDPEHARIVTACVALVGGGRPTETLQWLADPGIDIPDEAAKIHGITTEQARAEGQPAGQVVQQVVAALTQAVLAGIPIVAMNAAFDLTMLDREARRHPVHPLVDSVGDELRVLDPRVLDKQVDRFRPGGRKLGHLAQHYRVTLDGAHSADADAIAACRVVWRMGQSYPDMQHCTLDELHVLQIRWAREQAEGLRDYFARTPDKKHLASTVRSEWPLIPAAVEGVAP